MAAGSCSLRCRRAPRHCCHECQPRGGSGGAGAMLRNSGRGDQTLQNITANLQKQDMNIVELKSVIRKSALDIWLISEFQAAAPLAAPLLVDKPLIEATLSPRVATSCRGSSIQALFCIVLSWKTACFPPRLSRLKALRCVAQSDLGWTEMIWWWYDVTM